MDQDRWKTVNHIFHAALEVSPSERHAFVHSASNGDPELQAEVEILLKADQDAGSYLETPLLPGELLSSSAPPVSPGDVLCGRFQILRAVGEGGMGHVFEVYDSELAVHVALKIIRPEIASNPETLHRFRQEVRLARQITHPNVCRTFDIERETRVVDPASGTKKELVFLTMEFLQGETLDSRVKRFGPLPLDEALQIASQIADALFAAHSLGIVHRDMKPANIMLVPAEAAPDGSFRAVVTDFGLARLDTAVPQGNRSPLSHSGRPIGTLAYMAPEQLEGTAVSAATDIYAFGLILFEMVTGTRAFPADNFLSGIAKRISGPPPSPLAIDPNLPASWCRAIEGCLRLSPADRFRSATDVIAVLEGRRINLPRGIKSTFLKRLTLASWPSRRRLLGFSGVLCTAVALFFGGYRLYQSRADSKVNPGALVYLTQVKNQTGERTLDNLTELLQAGLNQSAQINLLDQSHIGDTLQLMTKPPDTVIDPPTAREIALRTGAVRVVFATVTVSAGSYSLNIDIQQPDANNLGRPRDHWSNNFKWTRSSSATNSTTIPPDLLSAVRKSTDWIRYEAGESKNDIARLDTPPEEVTTSSWEALHDYAEAMALYRAGRGESAVARLNEAVHLDPKFALAYGALGDVLYSQYRQAEGYQAYQRSLELGAENRLTKRESDQIRGMRAVDTGEFELAVEAFRDLAADYPQDPSAWTYPTIPLRMLGRDEEAISNLKHAMLLIPDAPFPPYALAQELMIVGRMDEAWQWVEFSRAHGSIDGANENDGTYHYLRAEYPAAEASFHALLQSTDQESRSTACLLLADLYAETGQGPKALEILSEGIREDAARKNYDAQSIKLLARAYVEANHREFSQALADEHAGYSMSPRPNQALAAEMALGAVSMNSSLGFQAEIRKNLLEIQHTRASDASGRMSNLLRLLNEGELDLVEGRTETGVTKLRSAALLDAPALHSYFLVQGLAIAARSVPGPSARQFGLEAAVHATFLLQHQSAFVVSYARYLPGVLSETRRISEQFQTQSTNLQRRYVP